MNLGISDRTNDDLSRQLDTSNTKIAADSPVVRERGSKRQLGGRDGDDDGGGDDGSDGDDDDGGKGSPKRQTEDGDANDDETKQPEKQVKAKPKRRVRRRKPAEYEDPDAEQISHLKEKFVKGGGKQSQRKHVEVEDVVGPLLRKSQRSGKLHVRNPSTHDRIIERTEEMRANKISTGPPKPEGGFELENAPWICAFCQQRTGTGKLGDLFGPYYVKTNISNWPSFLKKPAKSKIKKEQQFVVDLWLHGDCALWTKELFLSGVNLSGLSENIDKCWGQKCEVCSVEGAHIPCGGKNSAWVHYPCATPKFGYALVKGTYTAETTTAPALSTAATGSAKKALHHQNHNATGPRSRNSSTVTEARSRKRTGSSMSTSTTGTTSRRGAGGKETPTSTRMIKRSKLSRTRSTQRSCERVKREPV